jgi:hypothetical protein
MHKSVFLKAYVYLKGRLEEAYTNRNDLLVEHYRKEIIKLQNRFKESEQNRTA